jgi:acetolactate synthase-1/2/3 large subunit
MGTYYGPEEIATKRHKSYHPATAGDAQAIEQAVELMLRAERPVFYTGGGVINSGPEASEKLRELAELTGFPVTSTLMGLGSFPGSNKQWLGMLGMHGTYEANMAMHDCDLMINIGARFDDRITGRIDAFSPGSTKIHVDIDPSSINKNVRVALPIVGDCGLVLEEMVRVWRSKTNAPRTEAIAPWWKQIDTWRKRNSLAFKKAPDVGRAALPLRTAEPVDDLRRPRDDGLRLAGSCRCAGGTPGRTGHRHRRRSERADDDAGAFDGRAVPATDQDLHPQQ